MLSLIHCSFQGGLLHPCAGLLRVIVGHGKQHFLALGYWGKTAVPTPHGSRADLSHLKQVVAHPLSRPGLLGLECPPCSLVTPAQYRAFKV